MKKLLSIILLLLCARGEAQLQLTPVIYQGYTSGGLPQTNTMNFQSWPPGQPFYVVGTNIVSGFTNLYITPNSSGYFSNNFPPIMYGVTISNSTTQGFFINVPYTTNATSMSLCVTNTINVTQIFGSYYNLITNWLGFNPISSNLLSVVNAMGYTPCGSNYNSVSNALGYGPATNTQSGLISTLLYTPAGSNYASIVGALGFSPTNLPSGQNVTNLNEWGDEIITNGVLKIGNLASSNWFGAFGSTNWNHGAIVNRQDNLGNIWVSNIITASNGFASLSTYTLPAFTSTGWTNTNKFNVTVDFPYGVTNVLFSNTLSAATIVMTNMNCYSRSMGVNWIVTNSSASMSVTGF